MDPLKRMFGKWLVQLVPGIPNPSAVIQEMVLYRSAEEKSLRFPRGYTGDEMGVDLDSLCMPLEEPENRGKKQTTKKSGKDE